MNCSPSFGLYLSLMAHELDARRRKGAGGRPRLKGQRTASYVLGKLNLSWSPEQIAGRIGIDCPGLSISHEAIYQYISRTPRLKTGKSL